MDSETFSHVSIQLLFGLGVLPFGERVRMVLGEDGDMVWILLLLQKLTIGSAGYTGIRVPERIDYASY